MLELLRGSILVIGCATFIFLCHQQARYSRAPARSHRLQFGSYEEESFEYLSEDYLREEATVALTPVTITDVQQLLERKFPDELHIFVNPSTPEIGYCFAGIVDDPHFPKYARCWKSDSLSGLMRLISAEDAAYFPNVRQFEHVRRRFKL